DITMSQRWHSQGGARASGDLQELTAIHVEFQHWTLRLTSDSPLTFSGGLAARIAKLVLSIQCGTVGGWLFTSRRLNPNRIDFSVVSLYYDLLRFIPNNYA